MPVDLARLKELERAAQSKHYAHHARANFRERLEAAAPSLIAQAERCAALESDNANLRRVNAELRMENEAERAKASDVRQFIEVQRDMAVFKFREAEAEIHRLLDRVTEREEAANERGNEITRLKEPTEAMLEAAYQWSKNKYGKPIGNDAAIGCWKAMYAAYDRSAKP